MNKSYGKKTDFAPIKEDGGRIIVSYGYEDVNEEDATWYEVYLYKSRISQLTLDIVKQAVIEDINRRTTSAIIAGFPYTVLHGAQQGTEVSVWLSKENQNDFHAMHQNADSITFPVRYKVGELADGTPVYEEFANAGEMHAICILTTNHVLQCQQTGWEEKDAVDWQPYEELFPQPDPEPQPEPEEG